MAKKKEKGNSKAFAQQKRHRRQWLTFVRMCRYGVNNFSRNAWLSIAATAVMTITLLIIFITLAAKNVLTDSITQISKNVDMSIYLKTDTTREQADKIVKPLQQLSNVRSVSFISSSQARADNAEKNKDNAGVLNAITQATNKLPATVRVSLKNINDTTQLDQFVKTNKDLKTVIDPNRPPTFSGSRRTAIKNIAMGTDFAQKIGLGASIVFVAISSLIVFNTIRMAIFNRRDEIEMMKLIGAEKSFIRGPFVVEAMVYGFISALFATCLGIGILSFSAHGLESYGIAVQGTLDLALTYAAFILFGMIILGALIGTVSALLATRRYLKI